jgi:Ser/Thr protein kinase RdoA (MazF antagonist)
MASASPAAAAAVAGQFELSGAVVDCVPFSGGHINDSFIVTCGAGTGVRRYLLQRINAAIFHEPPRVMANIVRVTAHLAARLRAAGVPDVSRRVLTPRATRDGVPYVRDAQGAYWRLYPFIEGTRAHLAVRTPAQAQCAGQAFGEFLRLLADFPAAELHETIPAFHDTPRRLAVLEEAIAADPCGRGAGVRREIEFILARRRLTATLVDLLGTGQVPVRVVHNDAKLSNVLLDATTGAGLCVVDLDTVMPGTALFDFGDMVRSMTCLAAEDEPDAARVHLDRELFAALARGYLAAAGRTLTPAERANLVAAGQVITLEQAIRFLADYLSGDTYYRVARPGHNLDRARTQLALLADLERLAPELERCVALLGAAE